MKRSTERILTTHAGRLPILTVSLRSSKLAPTATATFDRLVKAGVADTVRNGMELRNDIHNDGEFWKATSITTTAGSPTLQSPLQAGEGPSILVHQQERHMPGVQRFYEVYARLATSGQASSTHSRRTRQ